MWKQRRVSASAEFAVVRHGELERWVARSLGATSHGFRIQDNCLLLPSQED